MGKWIIAIEPNAPPVRWQCVLCETPAGEPHKNCSCTLVEGVEIEDDVLSASTVGEEAETETDQVN